MWQAIAYCGTPPVPGALGGRFNLDPVLILALAAIALIHIGWRWRSAGNVAVPLAGWGITAAALISPLCALSVALFSARVAQHMILLLVAAPLVAISLPGRARGLWPATIVFMIALWFWNMPAPYDATLHSTPLYWAMHLSLFGTGVWLWHALIGHDARDTASALAAGTATSIQMGLLGAVLTLGGHPWFSVHYFTTEAWGLSPLADQQLGGVLMWVPGGVLFLWIAMRSLLLMWRSMEGPRAA